jgi:acyl carrier protein
MSLYLRLRNTLASTLKVGIDAIGESTAADDLPAWDSLGHVNLMMALEQTFGVYIEVEDFENLRSVPAILDYLARNGKA